MATEAVEALKSVPLLAGMGERDLARLARQFKERVFSEGSAVTSEGAMGAGFFVILEGNASVSVGGRIVRTLGPGDHFGEVALIDEGVRSASVTAVTDLRCVGITPWEFRPFVEEHPRVAWTLLRALAERLRAAETKEE